ncbi:MAG: hypothetical protein K6U02_10780 [Firmicutes bacterium]|jgi:hypothetical protein|nr:hypothetical protein [Bacillota bacterium]
MPFDTDHASPSFTRREFVTAPGGLGGTLGGQESVVFRSAWPADVERP